MSFPFRTYLKCGERSCMVIIDRGCSVNVISPKAVHRIGLQTVPHPHPYPIAWVGATTLYVTQRCLVPIYFSSYRCNLWCDVAPIQDGHIILGRPWLAKFNVTTHCKTHSYSFIHEGKQIKLQLPQKAISRSVDPPTTPTQPIQPLLDPSTSPSGLCPQPVTHVPIPPFPPLPPAEVLSEMVVQPIVFDPVVPDPVADPLPDPVADLDPVADPIPDPVADPLPDPVTDLDPVADPIPDPVADPLPDPVADLDPVADPVPDPVTDPIPDPVPKLDPADPDADPVDPVDPVPDPILGLVGPTSDAVPAPTDGLPDPVPKIPQASIHKVFNFDGVEIFSAEENDGDHLANHQFVDFGPFETRPAGPSPHDPIHGKSRYTCSSGHDPHLTRAARFPWCQDLAPD